jgi:hypothetical protein
MAITPFTDEQLRALVNLRQRYEVWRETERALRALPYDLRIKSIGGRKYLYEIADRSGNGKSLGPLDEEGQAEFDRYHADKDALQSRRDSTRAALAESGQIARAVRVPLLASDAGPILREADIRGLFDGALMVAGTNCMVAYALEAGGQIDAADETLDFDLAWTSLEELEGTPVWSMLKAVDPTFTLNTERTFQARNAKAYEVELLTAPSRAVTLSRQEQPRPIPMAEQEWPLRGKPVDHVAICRDATAVRLVAPDPRWFALLKLWLSAQEKRNRFKRGKDRRQGLAVLDAVAEAMPHYPLDAAFVDSIPGELIPYWEEWRAGSGR